MNNSREEPDPFPENRGSQFEYSQKDIPDICFFPSEKARWDGYKITNKNWNQLTDYQKIMFMTEAIEEIRRNDNSEIMVKDEECMLFVQYTNATLAMAKDESKKTEFPIIRLLYEGLKAGGRIKSSSAQ